MNTSEQFPTPKARRKTCPECGREFSCGPSANGQSCWCNSLPPVTPVDDGTDCRCPRCLGTTAQLSAGAAFAKASE